MAIKRINPLSKPLKNLSKDIFVKSGPTLEGVLRTLDSHSHTRFNDIYLRQVKTITHYCETMGVDVFYQDIKADDNMIHEPSFLIVGNWRKMRKVRKDFAVALESKKNSSPFDYQGRRLGIEESPFIARHYLSPLKYGAFSFHNMKGDYNRTTWMHVGLTSKRNLNKFVENL
ncbi:MAG: hypothetical protein ABH828_03770 [archaeon]